MKDCLRRLGIAVDDSTADVVRIAGRGGEFAPGRVELDVGQSAVTTRLMLAFAALRPDVTVVDGHISMRNRPNKDLVDALRTLGATLESTNDGHLPTTVRGTRALRGPVRVPGTISSQYLTSLLTIAPLIEGGLTIEVEGELTSKPYVDLTLDEMAKFGVQVDNQDYRRLVVQQQPYRAGSIDVEGDASAASYFAALATLHGARITLTNLGTRTRQGDYGFFALCEKLGAPCSAQSAFHRHHGPAPARRGVRWRRGHDQHAGRRAHADDARPVPASGRHGITGLATLRVKECDRIAAPTRELRKLGVTVEEGPDWMRIEPLPHRARLATRRSWKSRPITITASPCPSACSDRACRACGSSIRAAWPRPTRTTGATGSAHEALRDSRKSG